MATYGSYNISASVGASASLNTAGWVTQYTVPSGCSADVDVGMTYSTGGGQAIARVYDSNSGASWQFAYCSSSVNPTTTTLKLGPGQSIQFYTSGIVAVCSTFGVQYANA